MSEFIEKSKTRFSQLTAIGLVGYLEYEGIIKYLATKSTPYITRLTGDFIPKERIELGI